LARNTVACFEPIHTTNRLNKNFACAPFAPPNRLGISEAATGTSSLSAPGKPGSEVRWEDVVRVVALGTDALGPFQISVTFTHDDGEELTIFKHHAGYQEMIQCLPEKFSSISPDWYQDAKGPGHIRRLLYARESE